MRVLALLAAVIVSTTSQASRVALTTDARALQPGELVVLTVTVAAPADTIKVHAFGRELPAFRSSERVWQALVGIDLDTKPGTYTVEVDAGFSDGATARAASKLVVRAKQFATRRLTVDPDFVNPPPEAAERIARDARDLERVWSESADGRLWDGAFVRPVPQDANSAFGTRSVFNGQPRNPHSGADFLSPAGTPIHAPNAGRIVLARELYYSGNTVIIDHGLGLFSLFAHLSEINVVAGATVARGDVVGKVGATGRVTGAHLHWSVRVNGARVDPLSLVAMTRTSKERRP